MQSHPQIIKMLRYITAPTISQMRLGQIAGVGTTGGFEEKGNMPSHEQAERLARWFREHLDHERFPWIAQNAPPLSAPELRIAERFDSTKRLKELNDKHTDWTNSGLKIMTVGVCAGFFNEIELIATARGRGIPMFWEHNLNQLIEFVSQGTYYGSSWNAQELFPDVPGMLVRSGLESIQEAPKSIAETREEYTPEIEPDEV